MTTLKEVNDQATKIALVQAGYVDAAVDCPVCGNGLLAKADAVVSKLVAGVQINGFRVYSVECGFEGERYL